MVIVGVALQRRNNHQQDAGSPGFLVEHQHHAENQKGDIREQHGHEEIGTVTGGEDNGRLRVPLVLLHSFLQVLGHFGNAPVIHEGIKLHENEKNNKCLHTKIINTWTFFVKLH